MTQPDKTQTTVHVVSHTHWDREWYQTYQAFRTRLVYMMDELLEKMEQDPDYRYFTLDGQTIILEDYLDIRPENAERLRTLIREGRILIGPWYVMPDEFLVSGESLVRNLSLGIRQSRSWGVEAMKSGYVTDIFGHNSQFPQILQGFGIEHAVLFRGFEGGADAAEFWWEGADGSRVLGLKLDEDRSYGDFYFAIRWPFFDRDDAYEENKEELFRRASEFIRYKEERATTPVLLAMDGVDHVEIEPQLPALLRLLNESPDAPARYVHSTLDRYLKELRPRLGELQVLRGERKELGIDGINNWVPENTLSSRVHLKQLNQQCEHLLEKWAEPFAVIATLEGKDYPRQFLEKAWMYLLQNHPHDSICGCSIDQVHKDMLYRFDQSRLIGEQMVSEQLKTLSAHIGFEGRTDVPIVTVFNAAPSELDGIVEAEVRFPAGSDASLSMRGLNLQGTSFRLYDERRAEVPYQLLDVNAGSIDMHRPYRELPRGEMVDRFRIAFRAHIPALGYRSFKVESYSIESHGPLEYSAPKLVAPVRYPGGMSVGENAWDNGAIRVQVAPNGTLSVTDKATGFQAEGLLLFEDEADIGDGWSHMVPIGNETFNTFGSRAVLSTIYDGRYATRIRIRTMLAVPAEIQPGDVRRSEVLVDIPIDTYIDIKRDDPVLYCHTLVDNGARDHRLRVLFPTGLASATEYRTSTPFDLVARPIARNDSWDYLRKPFEVEPHNGLVTVEDGSNGVALYSKGLYEVIVRDNPQRTIALTLLRATRKEVFTDGGDGGQLLGAQSFHYAVRLFRSQPEAGLGPIVREQQRYAAGIRSAQRRNENRQPETPQRLGRKLPPSASYLRIDSAGFVLSSFLASADAKGEYLVRMWNCLERETDARLIFDRELRSACLVSLDEKPIAELPCEGNELQVSGSSKRIVTIRVRFA